MADSRFLQANERTLLAWVRTSLGLLAMGFVMARFELFTETRPSTMLHAAGLGICSLAPLLIVGALVQYLRVHRALRDEREPPVTTWAPAVVAALVAAFSTAIALALTFGL